MPITGSLRLKDSSKFFNFMNMGNKIIIDECYSKDEKFVYFYDESIPNSDPNTFKKAEEDVPNAIYFSYDKNQLYAKNAARNSLQIWTDVDVGSLEFFPLEAYFADKFHLYHYNSYFIEFKNHDNDAYNRLKLDLKKRKPKLNAWWNKNQNYYNKLKYLGESFFTDDESIYFHFKKGFYSSYPFAFGSDWDVPYYSLIARSELSSFEVLNQFYSKDKNSIYHIARPICADVKSFEVIDLNFAKDKNGIWYNGYLCKEKIDLDTMEIINLKYGVGNFSFLKDKQAVYFTKQAVKISKYKGYADQLVKLRNSDPATFIIFDEKWSKDKNNVYLHGKIWSQIDASTFEFLFTDKYFNARSYARDNKYLYSANGMKVVKNIEGESFRMLNEYWGLDNNHVFSFKLDKIIKNLDASTFKILDNSGSAEDNDHIVKYLPQKFGEFKMKISKKR